MDSKLTFKKNSQDWNLMFLMGAFGAWFSALLIPLAILSHIIWPPPSWTPGAALDWFNYINTNPLAGLLNLDFLLEIGLIVSVPLYIALYLILFHENRSLILIATSIAILGNLLHILSNSAWELLLLSRSYAAATTDIQRNIFLAAGEARLSIYYGMVFQVSYILGYLAYILIGYVMLRSSFFGKTVAYLAIIIGIAGFGFYIPRIGVMFSVLIVFLIGIWNVLIGWKLLHVKNLNAISEL